MKGDLGDLYGRCMYWLIRIGFAGLAVLIGLLVWFAIGCSMLSPDRRVTPTVEAEGSRVTQKTNDPTSINVLAYALGASVLIGSVSQAWYARGRLKHAEKNGR
jgi:hypothetical protein